MSAPAPPDPVVPGSGYGEPVDTAEPTFRVTVDPTAPAAIAAEGELDATSAPKLRTALEAAIAAGVGDIHLDLGGVTFIDSSGLQSITAVLRELRESGHDLSIASASRSVRRIFEVTGLRDLLLPS